MPVPKYPAAFVRLLKSKSGNELIELQPCQVPCIVVTPLVSSRGNCPVMFAQPPQVATIVVALERSRPEK